MEHNEASKHRESSRESLRCVSISHRPRLAFNVIEFGELPRTTIGHSLFHSCFSQLCLSTICWNLEVPVARGKKEKKARSACFILKLLLDLEDDN